MSRFVVASCPIAINAAVFYTFHCKPLSVYSLCSRICKLLKHDFFPSPFFTLALTSSSRIDKYTPWMLSWQSELLTHRNEWETYFPCPYPLQPLPWQMWEIATQDRRRIHTALWQECQLFLLNVHMILK